MALGEPIYLSGKRPNEEKISTVLVNLHIIASEKLIIAGFVIQGKEKNRITCLENGECTINYLYIGGSGGWGWQNPNYCITSIWLDSLKSVSTVIKMAINNTALP